MPERTSVLRGSGGRWIGWALLVALFSLGGLGKAFKPASGDLKVFTDTADRYRAGADLYTGHTGPPFTYPPACVLPYVPLSLLPRAAEGPVLWLVNVVLLCFALWLLRGELLPWIVRSDPNAGQASSPPSESPTVARGWSAALFWSVLAVLVARHVSAAFENKNVDLLVLACLSLTTVMGARGRDGWCGLWAGLGTAIKATPLLFLPIFLWQRRFRAAAMLLLVAGAATLVPDLFRTAPDNGLWVGRWRSQILTGLEPGQAAQNVWPKWNYLNQSLSGTLHRLTHPPVLESDRPYDVCVATLSPAGDRALGMALQVGVLAALVWMARPAASRHLPPPELRWRRYGEASAVVVGTLLLSPMSSKAHFAALILPISFLVAEFAYRGRDKFVGLALLLVLATGTLTVKDLWGPAIGNHLLSAGSITWCALAVGAGLMRVLGARVDRGSPAPSAELGTTAGHRLPRPHFASHGVPQRSTPHQ